jgi:ABC-type multidrug transport system ATPase subunit
MDEFEARRSAAYVSQHDLHMGELTVRETVNFSARCQGSGHRYGKTRKETDNPKLLSVAYLTLNY